MSQNKINGQDDKLESQQSGVECDQIELDGVKKDFESLLDGEYENLLASLQRAPKSNQHRERLMETPMPETKDGRRMTHSEFMVMVKLGEKVEILKGGLDTLLSAKTTDNKKQIAYWVGKNARDLTEISKLCMSEITAERLAQGKGGIA